jgi:hypothetical protein
MRLHRRVVPGLSAALLLFAAVGAAAGAPALPGRYKGKAVLETRVDDKFAARQKLEVIGILLQNGTLQLFFSQVLPLPYWETRTPQGALDTSGAEAVWSGTPNDDALLITLTGSTSPGAIKLGYDAGYLLEPGASGAAKVFFSLSLRRVGP